MELQNFTLPEFCFLDARSHLGDELEDRTVIQHIRTYTIIEAVALDEIKMFDFTNPTFKFDYINSFGIIEKHMLIVHFSQVWENPLPVSEELISVFQKTADWYCSYLDWEDQNILNQQNEN